MNLFAYVGGDPVNWVDPEGLFFWRVPFIILGGSKALDYAVKSYYAKQIMDMYAAQQRWIKKLMAEDPCELEKYQMLKEALERSVRNQARDAAKWGIDTIQLATPYATRIRK